MKNSNISQVLKDYLAQETEYAVMLTGAWGAGKTYYLKNIFFEEIKKDHSMGRTYTPVLISLFGIKTIDDVKDRIFQTIYPILQNKFIKMGAEVGKALLKSIDVPHFMAFGFLKDTGQKVISAAETIGKLKKKEIKLKDILISFDDLERADPELLKSKSLIGYINMLVEEGMKVIIIVNENELERHDESFKIIKEKTIGHTLYFEKDIHFVFSSIVNTPHTFTKDFRAFVVQHKNFILDLFAKGSIHNEINLRTLKFFLYKFIDIQYFLCKKPSVQILNEVYEKAIESVLRFTIGICLEYKKGKIDFLKREDLCDQGNFALYLMNRNRHKSTNEKKAYLEEFCDKYFDGDGYIFYESLYGHITGGDIFDDQKLLNELRIKFHIRDDGNVQKEYRALNKLHGLNIYCLEDEESKQIHQDVLKYVNEGKYLTTELLTVFYYLTAETCPLEIDTEKLCRTVLTSIENKANEHIYHPLLREYLSTNSSDPNIISIREKILQINQEKLNEINKDKLEALNKMLQNDFKSFIQEILNTQGDIGQLLSLLSPKDFLRYYLKSLNRYKRDANSAFFNRYNQNHLHQFCKELDFLTCLRMEIEVILQKKDSRNMSIVLLKQLERYISDAEKKIQAYNNKQF